MTDTLRKAAQDLFDECLASDFNEHWDSYKALRVSLANQPADTPVAWGMLSKGVIVDAICPKEHDREEGDYTVALYRRPPGRELTDAEIKACEDKQK